MNPAALFTWIAQCTRYTFESRKSDDVDVACFPFSPNHLNWIQKSLYPSIILWYIYTLLYLPLYLEFQDVQEGKLEDQFKTQFLKVIMLKKVKQH